jgi:hypothetical protein
MERIAQLFFDAIRERLDTTPPALRFRRWR